MAQVQQANDYNELQEEQAAVALYAIGAGIGAAIGNAGGAAIGGAIGLILSIGDTVPNFVVECGKYVSISLEFCYGPDAEAAAATEFDAIYLPIGQGIAVSDYSLAIKRDFSYCYGNEPGNNF